MRLITACALSMLCLGFGPTAFAHCGHHHRRVAEHVYRESAPDNHAYQDEAPDGDGCGSFREREQPYINGCGEYIPSDSGPGPGGG
jgi:hypothetical protein